MVSRTVGSLGDLRACQRDTMCDVIEAVQHLGPPPENASSSGALKVLRAASSTYMMSEPGVGDTVPLSGPAVSPGWEGSRRILDGGLGGATPGSC